MSTPSRSLLRVGWRWAQRGRHEVRKALAPSLEPWVRHRPAAFTAGEAGTSVAPPGADDSDLLRRITASYRAALSQVPPEDGSFWVSEFGRLKAKSHGILADGPPDEIARLLRDPGRSLLHYGFDEICASEAPRHGISHIIGRADWIYDNLRRLAEAVGVYPLAYPEMLSGHLDAKPSVETLLRRLDERFGFRVSFPNPFDGERGLVTSRGIASYRAVQALYQAWRVAELTAGQGGGRRVMEIGAGLGRTAYYSAQFGFERYTIVDIPLTQVALSNFLGRTLGADGLRLPGEPSGPAVEIVPPSAFLEGRESYDLIVNVDSLTEMARDTASTYWSALPGRTPLFLSINHEANPFTFRDLYRDGSGYTVSRHPYWLRRGYVEELVRFA